MREGSAYFKTFHLVKDVLWSTVGDPLLQVSNLQLPLGWQCQHLITEALLSVSAVLKEASVSSI